MYCVKKEMPFSVFSVFSFYVEMGKGKTVSTVLNTLLLRV